MMKRMVLILLAFSVPGHLFAEDTYLQLFDKVLAIEDKLGEGISDELLADLEAIREEVMNSPYSDLQTRIQIIDHLIAAGTENADFKESLQQEVRDISRQKRLRGFNTGTIITGSTSLLAGAVLTASMMLAESMHEQGVDADTSSEYADFMYKRDLLDTVSWISGGVLLTGVISTATLVALRPSRQETPDRDYFDFSRDLSHVSSEQTLFKNLVAKRVRILNELDQLHDRAESRRPLINFTKYTTITAAVATGICMILGSQAYYYYNHSDDPDTVNQMREMSDICLFTSIGLGALSTAGLTLTLVLDSTTSDKKLKKELSDVNNAIMNYPFEKE
ncbi:MAG: hypothetical protein JW874_03600 [Spirochaetales bacterium]|nr:hypothetical protein [Spirochaetales bacterium]